MPDAAEQLIDEIANAERWPLPRERRILRTVANRRALRRASALRHPEDMERVKEMFGWEGRAPHLGVGAEVPREYIHKPLARKIASAFGDFLWSGSPEFAAANEIDQPWIGLMVDENELPAKLRRATSTMVSEGEAWAKVHTDPEVSISPVLTFSSRLSVVPLWRGTHLLAAAFVTETVTARGFAGVGGVYWRHFEVHTDRLVRNVLFRGSAGEIGVPVNLDRLADTAALPDVWAHGLPCLAMRLTNAVDDDAPELGESDYDGVFDELRVLNEAAVIAAENARLTAKKRLFVAAPLMQPGGSFDAGTDVVAVDGSGSVLGEESGVPPVKAAEYSYDAEQLILHTDHLEDGILGMVGLVPQVVGRRVDGQAESGTALRVRFIPTTLAADGKARETDVKIPRLLQLAMMVDALPIALGGFNRSYAGLTAPPTVQRDTILPRDTAEIADENATAVAAGIRSKETAVRDQWPEWTEQDVTDELERIKGDEPEPLLPEVTAFDEPPADPAHVH